MLDTTSLSALVSALKAETQKDSITPERIGSILEKILDLIKSAATDTQLTSITSWKTTVSALGEVVTALSKGTVNATSVHLSYTSKKITTGAATSYADGIAIGAATKDSAGVMTATQVNDLATAKSNIELLRKAIDTVKQAVSTLETRVKSDLAAEAKARQDKDTSIEQSITAHTQAEDKARSNLKLSLQQYVRRRVSEEQSARIEEVDALDQKIKDVKSKVDSLSQIERDNSSQLEMVYNRIKQEEQARSQAIEDLEKSIDTLDGNIDSNYEVLNNDIANLEAKAKSLDKRITELSSKAVTAVSDMTHIECHVINQQLTVTGSEDLLKKGYVPVLFRYTLKVNRESDTTSLKKGHDKREKTNALRGWHLFYDFKKVMFKDGVLQIRNDTGLTIYPTYSENPRLLFSNFKQIFQYLEQGKEVEEVRVGFGKRGYEISKGHRFKFALAFAENKNISNKPFDFRILKTNLAIFKVFVATLKGKEDLEERLVVKYCV